MTDVLEFDNARVPSNLLLLRALGLPHPTEWRIEGDAHARYSDGALFATPQLVASCRSGRVCIGRLVRGVTPRCLTAPLKMLALIEAAVVRRALTRRGRPVTQILLWWAFDDGGHIEAVVPRALDEGMLHRAHGAIRSQEEAGASACGVVARLCCEEASGADRPALENSLAKQVEHSVLRSDVGLDARAAHRWGNRVRSRMRRPNSPPFDQPGPRPSGPFSRR
jgi:hypothetical protein